jgi:hypothetical protein
MCYNTVTAWFSRIQFLPKKALMQKIVHYAILAANSLLKNNGEVLGIAIIEE